MCRKLSLLTCVVLVLGLVAGDAIADPNLAVWYKLDESDGNDVDDSSSYNRDGALVQWPTEWPDNPEWAGFTPGWDPDGGHFGGCLVFYDDTHIAVPKSALSTVTNGITVSLWLKDAWRVGMNYVFDAGTGHEEIEEFRVMAFIGTAPDAEVLWRAGNDSNDTLRWDLDGGSVGDLEGWHNWTFVKDEVAGNIRIYFDGSLAESDDGVAPTLSTVLPTKLAELGFNFRIGSRNHLNNDLEGTVDDFVVYDKALSDDEVLRLYYTGGDIPRGIAWKPSPANRAQNLCPDVVLSWTPGDYADEHDVYFGTDEQAVEDATTASAEHRVTQGSNSYDAGTLETLNPGVTYYWRIDDVNDNVWAPPGSPWKGQVWEFTINDGSAFDPDPADGKAAVSIETVLSWSAGCSAASHKVYFSADLSDVESRDLDAYLGETGSNSIDPCAGDLEYLTDYYWVVDEVNGATTWSGQVWSFQTENAISDPNFLVWYRLDEAEQEYDSEGYEARDSSNYLRHGYLRIRNFLLDYSVPPWYPDGGRWGGSLGFDDDTAIWVPTTTLNKLSDAITIVVWIRDGSGYALQANGGDSQLLVDFASSSVTWRAGNDTNDVLTMEGSHGGWNHYAFIKDETDGTIKIYFNSELAASDDVVDNTLIGVRSKPFKIGGRTEDPMDFKNARMDEFMVYDRALTEAEVVRQYYSGGAVGELGEAWMPYPADGATEVPRDVQLTWMPGDYAAQHKLYFGTDWDDVNDMTEPCATPGVGSELYDPGILDLKETYYWRVDEVNDPCVWPGQVWGFTVGDFLILDNFEQYTIGDPCQIENTWYCKQAMPYGRRTGAILSLSFSIVNTGEQAMKYAYETDNTEIWDQDYAYADACLPLDEIDGFQDWTGLDLRLLTIFFYGQAGNDTDDTEQMYMAVHDSAMRYAEMRYGDNAGEDMNDLKVEEWQRWDIPFIYFSDSNFAAVSADIDFSAISSVYLGFGDRFNPVPAGNGLVYFDDLRLSMPFCRPEYGPTGDLSGDCFVGVADIGAMGEQWLRHDINVNPVTVPSDANLVAHWKLDGDANDSSANAYHGAAEGSYAWVTGKDGQAIDLSGGWVVVVDNGVTPKLRPKHYVSVMAWIYLNGEPGGDERVVIKGEDNEETFGLEANNDDGAVFIMRDASNPGSVLSVDSGRDAIFGNEWIHIAGTYDQNEQLVYVNGAEEGSETRGAIELFADANDGLGIGGRYGDTGNRFDGKIDDVRVYDRAVTRAEIAYIASGGDGLIPLESVANLYSGEDPEVINFKDFARLMESWLDEQLWPPEPVP